MWSISEISSHKGGYMVWHYYLLWAVALFAVFLAIAAGSSGTNPRFSEQLARDLKELEQEVEVLKREVEALKWR